MLAHIEEVQTIRINRELHFEVRPSRYFFDVDRGGEFEPAIAGYCNGRN